MTRQSFVSLTFARVEVLHYVFNSGMCLVLVFAGVVILLQLVLAGAPSACYFADLLCHIAVHFSPHVGLASYDSENIFPQI